MIEVNHLVKRYSGHTAVAGLTFSLEPGRIYGFLGPNGAGKSTTMNMMTGYLAASEGTVTIDGVDLKEDPAKAKAKIGYLPEQPPLYVDMTVSEYLEFVCDLKGVDKEEQDGQLARILELTRLGDVEHRLIRNLSKGYRQRVGLAQALVGFPELIILDEPTVGLDPKQIIEIRELIRGLAEEHTVILSSHILSEVQEVCDYVFIIHHGRLVAQGEPAELERQLSGGGTLTLTVKGEGDDLLPVLRGIPGVASAEPLDEPEPGASAFQLEYAGDADPRENIFRACVAADRPILAMERQNMTLEDIFLELTRDDVQPPEAERSGLFGKRRRRPENEGDGENDENGEAEA